ncbi:MAG: Gfo/Idh/MocA family oxidoreductase [Candidatus Poribacteria bacterium]|nr:Gfo/Idh/MocA family oxidoreductase [Candidatus Poribacteria bacterium]
MVRIGIIGIGFMGKTHYDAAQNVTGGKVTAICTRSEKKLSGDWSDIQGNFGGRGGLVDLSAVKKYRNAQALLDDPDIDMVDICLPTSQHKSMTIAALNAGKHVLLEKPIAVELSDADEMVAAAEKSGRKFFVAQVLRFWPEFAYIKQSLDSGEYGEIVGGNFKRVISAPDWGGDSYGNVEQSGGPGIDLHIHDTDFVNHLLGMPDKVFATGILIKERFSQYVATQYIYEDRGLSITAQSGALSMRGRPFEHGFDIYFKEATIQYNSSWGKPLCVVKKDGIIEPDLPGTADAAFTGEIQYAVDTITHDGEPTLLSGLSARNSLELCWREVESIRTGLPVSVG